MPSRSILAAKRAFTLIEASLCLMIIGLVIGGVFIITKNIRDDIEYEKAKSDYVYLLQESREFIRENPNLLRNDPNIDILAAGNGIYLLKYLMLPASMQCDAAFAYCVNGYAHHVVIVAYVNPTTRAFTSMWVHMKIGDRQMALRIDDYLTEHQDELGMTHVPMICNPADCVIQTFPRLDLGE